MNPFIWNGTFLGTFTDTNIIRRFYVNDRNFWEVQYNGYKTICMIKKTIDCTPCILDELKPLFKLAKLGSHYVYHGKYTYILYKTRSDDGINVAYENTLGELLKDNYKLSSQLVKQIRYIYIFRDIFKISGTNDSRILIRAPIDDDSNVYPVSFNESGIKLTKIVSPVSKSQISEVAYKKWFRNAEYGKIENTNQLLINMLGITNKNYIPIAIPLLKPKIDNICEIVSSKNYAHLSDLICTTLVPRLALAFIHIENNKELDTRDESPEIYDVDYYKDIEVDTKEKDTKEVDT
jgi:hypothetical protein